MNTKFFTNRNSNTLLSKFEEIFQHEPDIEFFDTLVGYFRSSGYFAIRPYLEKIPNIRILVGINVDKLTTNYHYKGRRFLKADPKQTLKDFHEAMKEDIQSSYYSQEVERGILQFIDDIVNEKIEIRAHPGKNLHAKIYIFRPKDFCEHKVGNVIAGSSNLTEKGLGKKKSANYEFNVLLNEYDDVKFALDEFEALWEEARPILPEEARKLKECTYLNDGITPYELYMKFLIAYFGDRIESDPSSIDDTSDYELFDYQKDAVNQGFHLLQKYNGFFLADVVGLGKTIIATAIAKKLSRYNGLERGTPLIIAPPSLKDIWEDTFDRFQFKNHKVFSSGSLHRIKYPENYDLVIVDEAHKFRNNTSDAYNELQKICKTPFEKQGKKSTKKVILVSATPLNNTPEDIRNLVALFQKMRKSNLEISDLQGFFAPQIRKYKDAKKKKDNVEMQEIVDSVSKKIRNKVIQPLTIRRTRTDLKGHERYEKDLKRRNIVFPGVKKPKKIYYRLNSETENLYDETIRLLKGSSGGLSYSRYRAIEFLNEKKRREYRNPKQISSQLAAIMKTLLVKRIDSSFFAFKESLKRFHGSTKAMIKMFENGSIYIAPKLNVAQYIMDDREGELIEKINSAKDSEPDTAICRPEDFEGNFLEKLKGDYKILENLKNEWDEIEDDPKLEKFLSLLPELLDKSKNPKGKLVVFSESKETTAYLVKELKEKGYNKVLDINSETRKGKRTAVEENFDANAAQQKDDYNIIISTEVLAEGVNLHRSNTVVNYDTPWNSIRLMQRIGRVNRIGSKASQIWIYNFFPTAKVDDEIELKKRAIMKLQAFHSILGEDSQIYSTDEKVESFGLFDENIEEGFDKELDYLEEVQKFAEEHQEHFSKIKNLPLRCRVGRRDSTRNKTTLSFIRNKRRYGFYSIKKDKKLEELNFLEIAKLLKAEFEEGAISLHDQHHDQVKVALKDFENKAISESSPGIDNKKSRDEASALNFLKAIAKDIADEKKKNLIELAISAIQEGVIDRLPKELNKLQKELKKTPLPSDEVHQKTVDIIRPYSKIISKSEESNLDTPENTGTPEIILSESFSK